jgi:sugar lactone lactonase YvrE
VGVQVKGRLRGPLLALALFAASTLHAALPLTDAFGYTASAGSFAWTDISASGVAINPGDWAPNADDGAVQINLPFNFRFYGVTNTKVYVTTNGYFQFGAIGPIAFAPQCLGINSPPQGIAAAYWMDLNPGAGGSVTYLVLGAAPNRSLLIQYTNVPPQLGTGTVTFQVWINEDNSLRYQYLSTGTHDSGASAVAGLRSAFDCPNRGALAISCQSPVLTDNLAIDISYPAIEPGCGSPTITPTFSVSPTRTQSPTRTHTPTISPTFSHTATISPSPTDSATATVTPTFTPTSTHSPSPSATETFSASPTSSATPTVTPSFSASPTSSATPSVTPSFSVSPTDSPTPTVTASFSASPTDSPTPSITETFSVSPTVSPTPSETPSFSASPTGTPTLTDSPTPTISPTATPTDSPTISPSPSHTPTGTPSFTRTVTATYTPTPTHTPTSTATATLLPAAPKPACLVLGQSGFSANTLSAAGSANFSSPGGVALDTRFTPFKVYVADTANHRVLYWNDASLLAQGAAADGVLGQSGFTGSAANAGGAVSASTLSSPRGLAVDGATGALWVADAGNHRVLRFSLPLAVTGTAADRVLGQGGSFSAAAANNGGLSAGSLSNPTGLSLDAFGRLLVADTGNHRVLHFDNPALSPAADYSYGQGGAFNSAVQNLGGVSGLSLNAPEGVLLDSGGVWVADSGNHRVLYYSTALPLTQCASLLLGQSVYTGNSANQGFGLTNETRLKSPRGLALDGPGRLLVADSGNHRVAGFEPPFANFAMQVWGQANLGTAFAGAGADNLNTPLALAANGATLMVADTANHRVLGYGCGAGLQAATATPTFTPTSTVSPTFSVTETRTASPTRTPSFSPSPSFSASPTFSITPTPSRSPTVSVTSTVSATSTVTRTRTPTATPTITLSLTYTGTVPPTLTPYPQPADAVIAYPNPASASGGGRVSFAFPAAAEAGVTVYDLLGQPVAVVPAPMAAAGFAVWDLRGGDGQAVAPGLYYVRVLSGGVARLSKFTVQ